MNVIINIQITQLIKIEKHNMQLDHNQYNNQCDTYQKTESTNQYHNHLNNQ